MAMVLFYERINWENFPSVVTPINEINLNKVDYAVKTLDERTVELYNKKAERSVVLNTIKDWSLDEKTGIITITKVNGDVVKFDLNIEKIPVNFELSEDGILTMTTDDGSVFTADIGAMIPVDVFENSDTISVSYETRIEVASNFEEYSQSFVSPYSGKLYITANDDYSGDVAPTYIITVFLTLYAEEGVTPVTERRVFHLSAGEMVETEVEFVSTLQIYGSVKTLEIPNTSGESKKRHYYFSVKDGSIKEKHLEPNYLSDIKVQAENAELSVTASQESAKEAKSYAIGGTGTREGEDTDNAKYYAELAKMAEKDGIYIIYKYGVIGDGVTDDTEAIQNFINDNAGNVLFFPEGTYRIANNIKIPSNTTLIGYGATILFEANNAMINASDGTIGGTVANKNINIVGFTFIANTTQNATSVAFGHANNCKVIDCTFSNNAGWHMIEVNSCDNIEISSCTFKDYGILTDDSPDNISISEIIQISYSSDSGNFPWFGPYDETPCTNIYIDKCSFYGNTEIQYAAIGNHSDDVVTDDVVKNIYITNCYFNGLNKALSFTVVSNLSMSYCLAENMLGIIFCNYCVKDIYMTNNIFIGNNVADGWGARAIYFQASKIAKENDYVKNFTIKNNTIKYFGNAGIALSGYGHIVENNIIQYNHGCGIFVGNCNYDSIYQYNTVTNNALTHDQNVDVSFQCVEDTDGYYDITGGNIVSENIIGRLHYSSNTPTKRSYSVNNITDISSGTAPSSNFTKSNNIVGGVLET